MCSFPRSPFSLAFLRYVNTIRLLGKIELISPKKSSVKNLSLPTSLWMKQPHDQRITAMMLSFTSATQLSQVRKQRVLVFFRCRLLDKSHACNRVFIIKQILNGLRACFRLEYSSRLSFFWSFTQS